MASNTSRPAAPAGSRQQSSLDPAAHEIKGAFGTIREHEEAHRTLRSRALALLAIIGPGLIVMIGDNDAGGVTTYAQAGQNYGTSLLWVLPVAGASADRQPGDGGPARRRDRRRSRPPDHRALRPCLGLVRGRLPAADELHDHHHRVHRGAPRALLLRRVRIFASVPIACVGLIGITASGSFRFWERSMFLFIFANVLVIPLFFMAHPHPGTIAHNLFVPSIAGGANSTSVLLIIAIVGTTLAPWQLFFQQSNIVDKRITPRWINYERIDTFVGAVDRGRRGWRADLLDRVRISRHAVLRPVHRRGRSSVRTEAHDRSDRRGVLRHCPAQRLADRAPARSRSPPATSSVTCSAPAARCTAALPRPRASTRCSSC